MINKHYYLQNKTVRIIYSVKQKNQCI